MKNQDAKSLIDYTERLEQEIKRLKQKNSVSDKLQKVTGSELTLSELLLQALEIALEEFDFEMGGIYLFEQDANNLVLVVQKNFKTDFQVKIDDPSLELKKTLYARFRMGSVLPATLPTKDYLLNRFVRADSLVKSVVFTAIRHSQKLFGVLCLSQKKPLRYSSQQLKSLALIGQFASLNIENHKLKNDLDDFITRYNLLLNNTLSGIFTLQDGRFIYSNERFARIHGYLKDEILKIDAARLEWPLDLQSTNAKNIKIKKKSCGDLHYECKGHSKNGTPLWLEMKAALITFQGKQAIMGNVIDITQEKQLEIELQNNEKRHRFLFEKEKDALLLAYPRKSALISDSAFSATESEINPESEDQTADVNNLKDKSKWTFEYFRKETMGEMRMLPYREMINITEQSDSMFFKINSHNAMIGILKSENDRQKFEDSVFYTSRNNRLILENLPVALFHFDSNYNFLWANKLGRQSKKRSVYPVSNQHCSNTYPFCKQRENNDKIECEHCILKQTFESGKVAQNIQSVGKNEIIAETAFLLKKESEITAFVLNHTLDINDLIDMNQAKQYKLSNQNPPVKTINDAIVAVDSQSVLLLINSVAEVLLGWKSEVLLHQPLAGQIRTLPKTYQKIFNLLLLKKQGDDKSNISDRFETEMTQPDGSSRLIQWSTARTQMFEKEITFIIGRDITLPKQMETELTEKSDLLENIIKFNPYGIEVFNIKGELIHSNAAANYIYGFKSLVDYCIFEDLALEKANVLDQIRQAFEGEIITIGPIWYDTSKTGYEGIPFKKVCVRITFSPIRSEDGTIKNIVAIHQDETQRITIENELNATEQRYQEVVETALDGIFRVDSSGIFSFVNPMMVQLTGYALEELIGLPLKQIIHEKSRPVLTSLFQTSLKEGRNFKGEVTIVRKDDREIILEVSVVPQKSEDGIYELQAICRDISERKKAEQSLRESKELYSILVEQSNDGVVLIRENGKLMFVNDGLCQMLGFKRKDLVDHVFTKVLPFHSLRKLFQLNLLKLPLKAHPPNFELRLLKKDRSILGAEINIKKVMIHNKTINMIHLRDVSARNDAEEKIHILSTAVESSKDGVFITDFSKKRIFANHAQAQMFGYSRKEWLKISLETLYIKSSVEIINEKIYPAVFSGKNWTGELTARHSSEEQFPILLNIFPIFKSDGQQLGVVGICKNITKQKNIEEELRKNNQFLEKFIDLNPYGVQILDVESRSIRTNKSFEKMFYPLAEEGSSNGASLIKNAEFQHLVNRAVKGEVVSDSPIRIQLKDLNRRIPDNRSICISVVLFPIISENQNVTNVVGLYENITEREKNRAEIERHNRELTALYDAGQAMVSIREPETLIISILKGATLVAGTEFGAYFTYSKEANIYRLSTTIGFSAEHLTQIHKKFNGSTPAHKSQIYWQGSQRNTLAPDDMQKATDIMSPENIFQSVLWVLVVYEERLLGVFNLYSKTSDAFHEESIRLVTMFADQAAVALENLRLYSELTTFAEEMEIKIVERTRELAASEAKFRGIIEKSPDLISIEDMNARTVFANPAYYHKLGYSPEETAKIGSLFLLHPDDLKEKRQVFMELQQGIPIRNLECRYRCKNGDLLYILLSAEKLKIGKQQLIQFIGRDITETRQLKVHLKKSEVHHQALLDNVKDGVFTINNNKIKWYNEQLATIFGYDASELTDVYIARLFADQTYFLTYEQDLYFSLAESGHFRTEFKGKRKNGETFDLECTVSIIDENTENRSEALVIVRDITIQKRMQEKLIQSERLAATGKLAASIAHEINNPLQGIMASLAAVKMKLEKINQKFSGLDIVETGLKRIGNIVKQLLSLHRPERQEKNWTNVNLVIEEVSSLMQSQLLLHKIKIRKNLSQSLPKIFASGQQLLQVFLNLLLNAQESMPDGGEIKIVTRHKNKNVMIKIIDTGKGIETGEISHIFDPFQSTKKKMGTGLGLSVVHSAIEAHGGKIEVNSTLDIGTEFTIYLPIQPNLAKPEIKTGNR